MTGDAERNEAHTDLLHGVISNLHSSLEVLDQLGLSLAAARLSQVLDLLEGSEGRAE